MSWQLSQWCSLCQVYFTYYVLLIRKCEEKEMEENEYKKYAEIMKAQEKEKVWQILSICSFKLLQSMTEIRRIILPSKNKLVIQYNEYIHFKPLIF